MAKKKVVYRTARISRVCLYDVTVEVDEDADDNAVDKAAMEAWGSGDSGHHVECYSDDLRVLPYSEDDQW